MLDTEHIIKLIIINVLGLNLFHSYYRAGCSDPGYVTEDFFEICKSGFEGPGLDK